MVLSGEIFGTSTGDIAFKWSNYWTKILKTIGSVLRWERKESKNGRNVSIWEHICNSDHVGVYLFLFLLLVKNFYVWSTVVKSMSLKKKAVVWHLLMKAVQGWMGVSLWGCLGIFFGSSLSFCCIIVQSGVVILFRGVCCSSLSSSHLLWSLGQHQLFSLSNTTVVIMSWRIQLHQS